MLHFFELTPEMRERSHFNRERWEVLIEALSDLPDTGCLVEIGVHRGGVTAFMSRSTDRDVYGYDTFGRGATGTLPVDELQEGILAHPMSDVIAWLALAGCRNVHLMECDVRTELPAEHSPIALAVIDLNLFAPTLRSLQWVAEHLVPGGRVLVDDIAFPGVATALRVSGYRFQKRGYMAEVWPLEGKQENSV